MPLVGLVSIVICMATSGRRGEGLKGRTSQKDARDLLNDTELE